MSTTTSGGSSTHVFEISEHFNLALLSIVIYSLEIVLIAFIFPGRVRQKVFNKDFMVANFGEEHRDATYQTIEKSEGYPDMGEGRYADKLPYYQWLHFAKAQRVHYNFLENWGPQVAFLAIGALSLPLVTAILGFLASFFRIFYSIGYMQPGGNANGMRRISAVFGDLILLSTAGISVYTCLQPYLSQSEVTSSPTPVPAVQPTPKSP